ncbi:unnamed protein product [Chrysoparadoxa australica]
MGPKKKGGKKGDDGPGEKGGELTDADKVKFYQSSLQSLQMELADRADETSRALQERQDVLNDLKRMQGKSHQIKITSSDIVDEKKLKLDITQDMTRQYKGMQEELLNRINQLEGGIQALQDELESSRLELERTVQDKDVVIEAKDREIRQLKVKVEDMAQEFGDMLKETLDRMRERIEVKSTGFDTEDSMPVSRRMEELSMAEDSSAFK